MRAISIRNFGDPSELIWTEVPDVRPGLGEVLIQTAATALNRADLAQRRGHYPPPPGESEILGLECSGHIAALGEGVTEWAVGDEACALLAGGGYGEQVVVPEGQLLPVPTGNSLIEAAALPEVACTVWSNVFMLSQLREGESFLCHGGSGGIGTMAIQLARHFGAFVMVTASARKAQMCRDLGAEVVIDYHSEDFVEIVKRHTNGRGADVILDSLGGSYLARNLDAIAADGRLAIIGLQGGAAAEIDLSAMMRKRATLHCTTLRSRTRAQKSEIVQQVRKNIWPLFSSNEIRPVVDRVLPIADAARAHEILETGEAAGKVVLSFGTE